MVDRTLKVQYRRGSGINQSCMIVQIYEQLSPAKKNILVSLIVEPENPDKEDAHYGTRKVQLHLGDEHVVMEVFPVG